jgi:glutamine amidotransferase
MITIIDYNAGNIRSVSNALDKLGATWEVTADPEKIRSAEKILFPGQGAAGAGMARLVECGLADVLREVKVPFLGICLGMQLLFEWSEEGDTKMLGLLTGKVTRFVSPSELSDEGEILRIPQMGWNSVKFCSELEANLGGESGGKLAGGKSRGNLSPLFKDIPDESAFYFVHSYRAEPSESSIAVSVYGGLFSAACRKDNFYGVQFHPEKSGEMGLKLLQNFIEL